MIINSAPEAKSPGHSPLCAVTPHHLKIKGGNKNYDFANFNCVGLGGSDHFNIQNYAYSQSKLLMILLVHFNKVLRSMHINHNISTIFLG